uniref:Helicase C-terminal domain-containing protein n=1 Tax=Brassica oleracea var. oleracea TaxID=109376 RepID=A0A0D3EHT1_BRAOL
MSRLLLHFSSSPMANEDDSPSSAEPSQQSQDDNSERYMVGFIIANIVGLKYYSGRINGRELVGLVREPSNLYDENAIRVLNTRSLQVGHIERAVAAVLSPLIDSGKILVEGIVPNTRSTANRFKIPCQVHVFAKLEETADVKSAISRAGLVLISDSDTSFGLSEAVVVKERMGGGGEKKSVDKIFKLVDENVKQKEKMVEVEPPREVIKSDLFAHQKEGLGWLLNREKDGELPPFWEEKDGDFVNVLTNYRTDKRPEALRGGVFADDMGLGKTLTLLSLIAFDRYGDDASTSTEETSDVVEKKGRKRGRGKSSSEEGCVSEDDVDCLSTFCVFKLDYAAGRAHCTGELEVEEAWEDSPVKKMEWPFLIKSYWQSLIQRPLGQGNKSGLSRLQVLMATISLRRTKEKSLIGLPPKTVGTCYVDLSPEERQLYDHMEGEAKDVTDKPELLQKLVAILQDGEDFDCPICISPPRDIIITRYLFNAPPPPEAQDDDGGETKPSTKSSKVTALLSLLMASRQENPNTKSVVFSQFKKMLLLLETPLKAAGFTVLRLDGAMTVKKRTQVISDFGKPELTGPVVLLASLKASGAGINLTAASRVYLFEPWWNPAVEEQAMDRIHRIGQKQEVKMIRMIARNSIEERAETGG